MPSAKIKASKARAIRLAAESSARDGRTRYVVRAGYWAVWDFPPRGGVIRIKYIEVTPDGTATEKKSDTQSGFLEDTR